MRDNTRSGNLPRSADSAGRSMAASVYKACRHLVSVGALTVALLLNLSITDSSKVSASTPTGPGILQADASFSTGFGHSVDAVMLAGRLTSPEEIFQTWPDTRVSAADQDCSRTLATQARNTVFHFEPHQTMLDPEYFGQLQVLADRASACPDIRLGISGASAPDAARIASILRVLQRRGYDTAQFKAQTPTFPPSDHGDGQTGRIEFTLLRDSHP